MIDKLQLQALSLYYQAALLESTGNVLCFNQPVTSKTGEGKRLVGKKGIAGEQSRLPKK